MLVHRRYSVSVRDDMGVGVEGRAGPPHCWGLRAGQGLRRDRAKVRVGASGASEGVCHTFGEEGKEQIQPVGCTFVLVSSERGDSSNGWAPGRGAGK